MNDTLENLSILRVCGHHRIPCPVHGGHEKNCCVSVGDRVYWKCYSHNCHEQYGSDLIGLLSGIENISREQAIQKYGKVNSIGANLHIPILKHSNIVRENIVINPESLPKDHRSPYLIKRGFKQSTLNFYKVYECHDKMHRLYNRVNIPILDENGIIVGITGRTLGGSTTKWIHHPKNFHKSNILYNLHFAKKYIYQTQTCCIVEGPLDVWRLFENRIYNAVSVLGTSISKRQIELLKTFDTKKIIMLGDPDNAGMKSTMAPGGLLSKLSTHFDVYSLRHLLDDDVGDKDNQFINSVIKPEIYKIVASK